MFTFLIYTANKKKTKDQVFFLLMVNELKINNNNKNRIRNEMKKIWIQIIPFWDQTEKKQQTIYHTQTQIILEIPHSLNINEISTNKSAYTRDRTSFFYSDIYQWSTDKKQQLFFCYSFLILDIKVLRDKVCKCFTIVKKNENVFHTNIVD